MLVITMTRYFFSVDIVVVVVVCGEKWNDIKCVTSKIFFSSFRYWKKMIIIFFLAAVQLLLKMFNNSKSCLVFINDKRVYKMVASLTKNKKVIVC